MIAGDHAVVGALPGRFVGGSPLNPGSPMPFLGVETWLSQVRQTNVPVRTHYHLRPMEMAEQRAATPVGEVDVGQPIEAVERW